MANASMKPGQLRRPFQVKNESGQVETVPLSLSQLRKIARRDGLINWRGWAKVIWGVNKGVTLQRIGEEITFKGIEGVQDNGRKR